MLKTLLILSVLSDNVLYVSRPSSSKSAFITFDYNVTQSITWHRLQYDFSSFNLRLYRININNFLPNNDLHFKVHYVYYKNSTKTSNWQPVFKYSPVVDEKSLNFNFNDWILLCNSYLCLIIYLFAVYYVLKKIRKPLYAELNTLRK